MENRPAPLRSRRVCRFCLTETEPLSFVYERDHSKPFQVPLPLQIMSCVAIEVYAADGMPQMICAGCRRNLDRSYKFKLQCKKADEALRAYPMTGVLPRPFPPITAEHQDSGSKRSNEQRMQTDSAKKPRVDNGDRERQRERERERQHDKQNMKVERNDLYKEEQEVDSDGDQDTANEKDDRKLEPGEIRVHACDQCERTFPLRQSLQLHVQRAHRDRDYKCTECDRMFFTIYDLGKHMSIHSSEKPFSCTICNKTFSRPNLLQRHEKVHRDDMRYGCQHCDREFFTPEELEKHEDSSHKTTKPYQCNICNKRFTYKQGLERHELLHNEDKTFVCEYCKEAFRTSTKLARHLSTHSGHRPYLCKLCPRKFLLSHHLTRHMRSHSVEKRHVCEDCGKAFKRKESLEVHQLTHSKRSGMGLTCDVCQESCRNRADYVTHIKQHIEAGEKMGPDGLQPDKDKIESESEEEEEDEEAHSDGDDDYEPPAYVVKKMPKVKNQPADTEEDDEMDERMDNKEDRKEQVVFVRNKDGNIVKKTIKTLMPIQRREISESPKTTKINVQQSSAKKSSQPMRDNNEEATVTKTTRGGGVDDTEAEVQKIVASVFKEHKIPLKHTNIPQETSTKENSSSMASPSNQIHTRAQTVAAASTSHKEDKNTDLPSSVASQPKSVNTVKVIKRIVVRKPVGTVANEATTTTTVTTPSGKDSEAVATSSSPLGSATKVTKRVIVRRIIRQGDTTREVIMNPDGTIIDPAELAKLPTGNVVKRVVVKKALDNKNSNFVQQVLKPLTDSRLAGSTTTTTASVTTSANATTTVTTSVAASSGHTKSGEAIVEESSKFELKTSQSSNPTMNVANVQVETKKSMAESKGDRETKEKLEQLEKRVEQQRIKIEELQALKQQETEPMDESLPDRHDESEDEQQQLPLKRVFVKRKQSIYDEEQEYSENEGREISVKQELESQGEIIEEREREKETLIESPVMRNKQLAITSSKVYTNKKVIFVKTEDPSEVEEMSREISSILNSADNVVKMQENVLTNLSQISGLNDNDEKDCNDAEVRQEAETTIDEPMEQDDSNVEDEVSTRVEENQKERDIVDSSGIIDIAVAVAEQEISTQDEDTSLTLVQQDMSASDIFESTDSPLMCAKPDPALNESVIELPRDDTINLNDTNESQDSLEDKLSQMEG